MLEKRYQISDLLRQSHFQARVRFQTIENWRIVLDFKKFIFGFFVVFYNFSANAQCAMCRASLEGEGNVAKAKAVNDGIVYLMVIPYVLAGFVAIIIYRMYVRRK